MNSVSPVLSKDHVKHEKVIALDQPQYEPIIILPTLHKVGPTMVKGATIRMRFDDAERKLIAEGADLLISELTFGDRFTPLSVWIENPRDH